LNLSPDELHHLLDLIKDEKKLEKEFNQMYREEKLKFEYFDEESSLK